MSKEKIFVFALTVALLITVQTVRAYTLAPDFTMTGLDGKTFALSSFRGKVVLLEFFATWCPHCWTEASYLKTVKNYFGNSIAMISVSMDKSDWTPDNSKLLSFKNKYGITWTIAKDTAGAYNLKYNGKFCGRGIPQIYIIDQAGYIRYCHLSDTSSSTLITEIKRLISPTITVTSPNGGEKWVRGTVHTITWTSVGSPGAYVKIELLKGGVVNRVISSSTANDGSYSWTIPSTQTLGIDYKMRITSTSNSAYTDSSNNNFAITG